MVDSDINKYYLLIRSNQIKLVNLNQNNQITFLKETLTDNSSLNDIFKILEIFLDQNLIECEKRLKSHIKEIILIIDSPDFLTIDMSTIKSFKDINQTDNLSNLILDLRNNLKKGMENYEVIHSMINKYIVDGKDYSSIPMQIENKNIFLEIRFICLKASSYLRFKKICAKYQIKVKNVLYYNYINDYKSSFAGNIFDVADKILTGLNENEISLLKKKPKNKGFFEKFFNFFS